MATSRDLALLARSAAALRAQGDTEAADELDRVVRDARQRAASDGLRTMAERMPSVTPGSPEPDSSLGRDVDAS